MSTPALEVSGLKKRFGGLPATRDVSLSVMPGERRLIIGPNGAGKTTLFNLITGDLTPDAGSVKLFGRELLRVPTQQRVHLGLARTYQILTLFPKETLCHNVVLALLYVAKHRHDFTDPVVHFAPRQLFEIMGWAPNSRSYDRLREFWAEVAGKQRSC